MDVLVKFDCSVENVIWWETYRKKDRIYPKLISTRKKIVAEEIQEEGAGVPVKVDHLLRVELS